MIGRTLSRIRRLSQPALPDSQSPESGSLPMAFACNGGVGTLDRLEGAPLPVLRAFGWFSLSAMPRISLRTRDGRELEPLVVSRMQRPDVLAAGASAELFCGFRIDFLLQPAEQPLQLVIDGRSIHDFVDTSQYATLEPHYEAFFTQEQVMDRDSIYGSGPPTDVSVEFKAFAGAASGKVLDFGCGNGDLLRFLRGRGAAVTGLELDEPRIRNVIDQDLAAHVVLYPGGVPLPFADESFDWVVSTEVIEHVPGIADYVAEFARMLRPGGQLLVTTPDITSIPSSFPAGCVPWHLLEATHINFFTPQSVTRLFAGHFDLEATYCLGATRVNGWFVPGSIGAIFRRK
jgi:2-polyprenyl-3-methyl-5-hydroxy-6-metoxy-1,4-benzoquinol methylase